MITQGHSMKRGVAWLAAAGFCAVWAASALAAGMRVQPGGALIQGLPVGHRSELPVPITIFNDDPEERTVQVTAVRPSEVGAEAPRGYAELPDTSWIAFSPQSLAIPPLSQGQVKMFVTLPGDTALLNQHWSVSLAVRAVPGGKQQIGLAIYPRFEMETGADRTAAPPLGPIAVSPSVVAFERIQPGAAARQATLRVWNNTDDWLKCRATVHGRPDGDGRPIVALSNGWSWLPDASWLCADPESLDIAPKSSADVTVSVAVPDGNNYGGAWEAVLFVETEKDLEAFARLRITTNSR